MPKTAFLPMAPLNGTTESLIEESKTIDISISSVEEKPKYTQHRLLTEEEERMLVHSLVDRRTAYRNAVQVCAADDIADMIGKNDDRKVHDMEKLFYMADAKNASGMDTAQLMQSLPEVATRLLRLSGSIRGLLRKPRTETTQRTIGTARANINTTLSPYMLRMNIVEELSDVIQSATQLPHQNGNGHPDAAFPILHSREETPHALDTINRCAHAYHDVAHALLAFNTRFVANNIKKHYARYRHRGTFADFRQEAILGFLRAMETMDDRGQKVVTYAEYWVKRALREATAEQGPDALLLTTSRMRQAYKLWNKLGDGTDQNGDHPLDPAERKLLKAAAPPISLSTTFADSSKGTNEHLVTEDIPPDEQFATQERRQSLDRALAQIDIRHEAVVRMRMGLPWRPGLPFRFEHRPEGYTLEEIRQYLGLTKERVRQLEAKGLKDLRHPSIAAIVQPFFYQKGSGNGEE